jgi:cytochrome d ubiquinol oxidase subunit I
MKFAAMEAQWETSESPAPWSLFALIDEDERRNTFNVEIPVVGSILADNSLTARYEGMIELNEEYRERYGDLEGYNDDYIPPVTPVYWSFRLMVAIGSLLLATAFLGLFLWWRKRDGLDTTRWYLALLVLLVPLPWVANFLGWIVTELGPPFSMLKIIFARRWMGF